MSAPAYLPLFGSDYLADTRHLSTEEHGAYLLLMIAAWRQDDCGLPNDDKKLARVVGLTIRKWLIMKATILEFWVVESGRIYQQRLRKERGYANQKSESNRKNIGKRWSKQVAENVESASYERIYDGNTPQPQPQIEAKASSASEVEIEFGLVADIARLAGISTPDTGAIAKQSSTIHQWTQRGASADLIRKTVGQVMAKGVKPRSLHYFTPAIDEAIKAHAPGSTLDAGAMAILQRLGVSA